eukprot:7387712-Prymnesium_polylepis.1
MVAAVAAVVGAAGGDPPPSTTKFAARQLHRFIRPGPLPLSVEHAPAEVRAASACRRCANLARACPTWHRPAQSPQRCCWAHHFSDCCRCSV